MPFTKWYRVDIPSEVSLKPNSPCHFDMRIIEGIEKLAKPQSRFNQTLG